MQFNTLTDHGCLITWGYHESWHGPMGRQMLNGVSTKQSEKQQVVWQRPFHALYASDAALRWMDLDEESQVRHPQIDAAAGHFFETGLAVAETCMLPYLPKPERFRNGLRRVRQTVHLGGHTTITDIPFALFDQEQEGAALRDVLHRDDTLSGCTWRCSCRTRARWLRVRGRLRPGAPRMRYRAPRLP